MVYYYVIDLTGIHSSTPLGSKIDRIRAAMFADVPWADDDRNDSELRRDMTQTPSDADPASVEWIGKLPLRVLGDYEAVVIKTTLSWVQLPFIIQGLVRDIAGDGTGYQLDASQCRAWIDVTYPESELEGV